MHWYYESMLQQLGANSRTWLERGCSCPLTRTKPLALNDFLSRGTMVISQQLDEICAPTIILHHGVRLPGGIKGW